MGPHGNKRFCIRPKWHLGKMGPWEWVTKEVDTSRNGYRNKWAVGINGERVECKWVLGRNGHWQAADTWENWHRGKTALKQISTGANKQRSKGALGANGLWKNVAPGHINT